MVTQADLEKAFENVFIDSVAVKSQDSNGNPLEVWLCADGQLIARRYIQYDDTSGNVKSVITLFEMPSSDYWYG